MNSTTYDWAKFRKYWEEINKPEVEYFDDNEDIYVTVVENNPYWSNTTYYRIKDDVHHELRLKWVNSDYTLPIEYKSNISCAGWIKLKNSPKFFQANAMNWWQEDEYREYKEQTYINTDIEPKLENLSDKLKSIRIKHIDDCVKEEVNYITEHCVYVAKFCNATIVYADYTENDIVAGVIVYFLDDNGINIAYDYDEAYYKISW